MNQPELAFDVQTHPLRPGDRSCADTVRDPARSHLAALVLAYAVLPFALALPLTEALPDTTLTNAALLNMLHKWEVPTPTEAHSLELLVNQAK